MLTVKGLKKKINITATTKDKISFNASAKEDDFIPDIGERSINVNINDLILTQNNIYPIEVTVAENKGMYSGNIAIWKFDFSVTRKASISDIMNNILH